MTPEEIGLLEKLVTRMDGLSKDERIKQFTEFYEARMNVRAALSKEKTTTVDMHTLMVMPV